MKENYKSSINPRDFISERVSDGYHTTLKDYFREPKLYMFHEDLLNSIFPWQGYEEKNFQFRVTCEEGDSKDALRLADIIVYNLPVYYGGHNTHTARITDFVRKMASEMFMFGEAFYEVKCKRDENDSITGFGMASIYPPSVRHIFGLHFQFIPKKVAKKYQIRQGLRYIPKDQIMHLKLPKQLGGKRSFYRIIKRIASLSNKDNTIAHFLLSNHLNNTHNIDINNTHLLTCLEIAKITRLYGWNQREHISGKHNTLEYYEIYRSLIAAKASAYLRESIVKKLNNTLNNCYLHTELEITSIGLNTTSDVDILMAELGENNKKSLVDIWKRGFKQTHGKDGEG